MSASSPPACSHSQVAASVTAAVECAGVGVEEAEVEWQPLDWYASPLYYDIVFDEDTAHEAQWLDALYTLFGPLPSSSSAADPEPPPTTPPHVPAVVLLEPACGSGRLLHALLLRGYHCIGFDRQPAAVQFARARCEAAVEARVLAMQCVRSIAPPLCPFPSAASSSASASSFSVFVAELTDFASAAPPGALPSASSSSVHMAHCLVSSLKYLLSEREMLLHLRAVAAVLVNGGLYVIALHLCDYSDQDSSSSMDEHEAERGGVRVCMKITCGPPDRGSRSEQVHVRMAVTHSEQQQQQRHYRWEESMRTYDRAEVWRLLTEAGRWYDVLATFDYEQARRGVVEQPLEWPQHVQTDNAADKLSELVEASEARTDWPGWEEVEAVAIVLRRKR